MSVLKLLGSHKHIVTLHDQEEDQDSLYLFMEYCPGKSQFCIGSAISGGDLYNFIEKNGTLTEHLARALLRQLISALEFCHGKGYVHHDVKLENSTHLTSFTH